ncbi:hypothetical protein SAMN04487910_2051 [Aquimarina amphilecti]|uniref:Uncharacterized protein n=1 Tax=Aquimarina amphilecti TaxID=1038014 RepID=A0A1H7NFQ6_AQUAM|nr:hypothetical protein [Aquimarina amphilecti]SEL21798.1 hypothetical protein SAMN04487910_2051 [Aquimarina amphilecti]
MGGFGSAQGMITSLKNNSRRNKREAFDRWTSSDKESNGIEVEPVSEEVLIEIRNKIQKQNRITTIKITVVIVIGIIATTWLLF